MSRQELYDADAALLTHVAVDSTLMTEPPSITRRNDRIPDEGCVAALGVIEAGVMEANLEAPHHQSVPVILCFS